MQKKIFFFLLLMISGGLFAQQKFGSTPQLLSLPNTNATVAGNGKVLSTDATGKVILVTDSGYNGIPISSLLPAVGTNSINNTNYAQTWSWNSLGNTAPGLLLSSSVNSSTAGIFKVANTSASGIGILASIQSNSTAGSGLTVMTSGNVGINDNSPANTLTDSGSFSGNYITTPAGTPYNALNTDYYINWQGTPASSSTNDRINLPAALAYPGNYKGRLYIIRNNTNSNLFIYPNGTETIDGLSVYIVSPSNSLQLISNGNTTGSTWDAVGVTVSGTNGSGLHVTSFLLAANLTSDATLSIANPTNASTTAASTIPLTAFLDPTNSFAANVFTAPFSAYCKISLSYDYVTYWTNNNVATSLSNVGILTIGLYDITAGTYVLARSVTDFVGREVLLNPQPATAGTPMTTVNFIQLTQGHQYRLQWITQYYGTNQAGQTYNAQLFRVNSGSTGTSVSSTLTIEQVF